MSNKTRTRLSQIHYRQRLSLLRDLNKYGCIDQQRIYATGFSGGGLVALCAGLWRPDLFAGIGDFKGNFYQWVLEAILGQTQTSSDPNLGSKLKVFISMGGTGEAPRVLQQVPLALDYLKERPGVEVVYYYYPSEGHVLTKLNFEDFWESIVVSQSKG